MWYNVLDRPANHLLQGSVMTALVLPLDGLAHDRAGLRLYSADSVTRATRVHRAANRFVLAWLAARTLGWTMLMTARPNPPLDVIEWLSWGRHWQMGYHKHPPLAAWVAEVGWTLTPGSFFGIYLLGYLAVALALWSVWNLARQVLPLRSALAATLCLEGLVYLGQVAGEFNNQVLLVGFWAMLIDRAYAAWKRDRLRDWILVGVALGLALLCKYSVVFLLVPLLGWWLWQSGTRRFSRLLVVAGISGMIFLPHLIWLCRNDFITLRYASRRAQGEFDDPGVLVSQLSFVLSQVVRLSPVLLILAPLLTRRRGTPPSTAKSYLLVAVVGPIALHLLAGLSPGTKLRDIWGVPLWTFAPAALLLLVGANPGGRAWGRFRLLWVVVGVGGVCITGAVQVMGWPPREGPRRVTFPGAALAAAVTHGYERRHGVPPAIAAGDWWLAGNICCLAPSRPTLYSSREPAGTGHDRDRDGGDPRRFAWPEPETAPWTSDDDLRRRGGVLLWCAATYGEDMPDWLHARFPTAEVQRALALPWTGGGEGRARVGWAMIAPRAVTR